MSDKKVIAALRRKCAECGRFVAYQDIADGKATSTCITPDSEWSSERIEVLCKDHAGRATLEDTRHEGEGK